MKEEQSPENKHSYWLDTINLEPFEKLKQSTETDVGIVGGGITGLTAAYMLAKQNKKVTLIDADNLLHGTTGYTTAKITAQHGLIYDELIQHFGEDNASLYYKAAMEAKDIIENHISELNIDCDFKQEDAYIYTNDNKYVEKMKTEAKAYEKLGIPGSLADNMPLDIPHKAALVMHNQAQFHPLKYLAALIKACVDAGVAIYENTTATDVEYNKHPAIITKDGSRIRCRYVIIASHFPFYDGQGFYPTRLYAERAYVVGIKAKKKFPGGMYINAETPTRSVRSTGEQSDDLWLIVGENHKTGQGETMNNHYDALEQFADKNFGISEVLYRWSTQDLTTLDKVPYIGQITKSQHNVFVATGYRKWGMTNGTIAAKIISDAILDRSNDYATFFTPARRQADPFARKFVSVNADVAKHLVKGKLDNTKDDFSELHVNEAVVTRIDGRRTGVFKDANNQIHMVDTTCTHLGCEVAWNDAEQSWDCPCHGSRFSYTGEVIEGPAKRPLKKIDRID